MGGVRVAVAVVLSVISLTVLSLHVALCLHYPSPLFAVTLLLNPSLWLFLGLMGMGCALLLSYRDSQRKVRSGLCTTCHTRYGTTTDTKWHGHDTIKWPDGQQPLRGPSRAIYSYSGNSHKLYHQPTYGTINEKQSMEMTRAGLVGRNGCHAIVPRGVRGGPGDATVKPKDTLSKDPGSESLEASEGGKSTTQTSLNGEDTSLDRTHPQDDTEETCSQQKWSDDEDSDDSEDNGSHSEHESSKDPTDKGKQLSVLPQIPATHGNSNELTNTGNTCRTPGQKCTIKQVRYCDCLARYGDSQYPRHAQMPMSEWERRGGRRYPRQYTVMGKYNKKLWMQCKLKQADNVPLELFTAKTSSSDDNSGMSIMSSERDMTSECGSLPNDDVPNGHVELAESTLTSQAVDTNANATEEQNHCPDPVSAVECHKDDNIEGLTVNKVNESRHALTTDLVPVQHTPPSPSQPTPPPGCTAAIHTGVAPCDLASHGHEPSDDTSTHGYDQDGASVSSDSGLLPAPGRPSMGRDFLRSPLWRPFRGSKKDRKPSANVSDVEDDEESQQSQTSTETSITSQSGESKSPAKVSGRSYHRQSHRLRSLFGSKKGKNNSAYPSTNVADRKAPGRPVPAGELDDSPKESPTSPSSPTSKVPLGIHLTGTARIKSSAAGARRLAKSVRPSSSPAKSVRSLVLKNLQKSKNRSPAPSPSQDSSPGDQDTELMDPVTHGGSTSPPSAFTSPSVRPKERKKARTRLKGKHRHDGDSKMLLSDDATD